MQTQNSWVSSLCLGSLILSGELYRLESFHSTNRTNSNGTNIFNLLTIGKINCEPKNKIKRKRYLAVKKRVPSKIMMLVMMLLIMIILLMKSHRTNARNIIQVNTNNFHYRFNNHRIECSV